MKKLILLFAIAFYLNANDISAVTTDRKGNDSPGYVITVNTGEIENAYIYFSRRESGGWINLDSAKVGSQEKVEFTGELSSPEVLYIRLENSDKPISFFAENSTIEILPDFDEPENTRVKGSNVHDEYTAYLGLFNDLNAQRDVVYKEYMDARKSGDEAKMEELVAKFNEFSEKEMTINKNYVDENKGSWVSPYVIRRSMYYSLSVDELKSVVAGLENKVENSVYVKELNNHINVLERVAVGKKFTDFELPTPDGESLALSEIIGDNYILIDFWASWCGPCRRENPHVVAMYNEYKDKGFDIIGVSFDNSRENWLKAIDDDKLTWHHVSDLKGWGSAAGKLYGVNSIPHTVLLDPDGVIIAKNLRGDALKEKLDELLTP